MKMDSYSYNRKVPVDGVEIENLDDFGKAQVSNRLCLSVVPPKRSGFLFEGTM